MSVRKLYAPASPRGHAPHPFGEHGGGGRLEPVRRHSSGRRAAVRLDSAALVFDDEAREIATVGIFSICASACTWSSGSRPRRRSSPSRRNRRCDGAGGRAAHELNSR